MLQMNKCKAYITKVGNFKPKKFKKIQGMTLKMIGSCRGHFTIDPDAEHGDIFVDPNKNIDNEKSKDVK